MTTELPRWVWDLVADLDEYEDVHGAGERCLHKAMARVPAEVRATAEVIAQYRKPRLETTAPEASEAPEVPA